MEETALSKMREGIKEVFAAVPKGKFGVVFQAANDLEIGVNQMAALLDALRSYFLETTGEASPFVKRIDKLVPRKG